jgi:hypothetical protein
MATPSHIISKKQIHPIIIPTQGYQDKYGNYNTFVEMNPSLYIDDDGIFVILVRTVNYLKYKNKAFTIYGNSSTSLYSVIRGKINDMEPMNLDECNVKPVNVLYNIPQQPSLWYGIEDVRFIDSETILTCIPECNNSVPCIFKGKLEDNNITGFEKCNPSNVEKNWMPYDKTKVIYSVCPFIIKSIITNDMETIKLDEKLNLELDGWHGSSNGIDLFGEKVFLIHKNKDRVWNRWLIFNPNTKSVRISKEFVFFKDSYFEFVCSFVRYKDRIFVSVGINDNKAFIIELDIDTVKEYCK